MEGWASTTQICEWLKRAGFDDCVGQAKAHGLNYNDMMQMTDERVERELLIADPGSDWSHGHFVHSALMRAGRRANLLKLIQLRRSVRYLCFM